MTQNELLAAFQQSYNQENYEEAKGHAATLLNAYPKNKEGYINLGLAASKTDDVHLAKEAFSTATFLDTQDTNPLFYLGSLELQNNDLMAAKASLNQVLILDPSHTNALSLLATIAVQEEKLNTAIEIYQRIFDLGEKRIEHIILCVELYRSLGEYEKGLEFVNTMEDALLEKSVDLCIIKLDFLQRLERLEEAISYTQELLDKFPTNPLLLISYASLLDTFESFEQAASTLEFAVSLETFEGKLKEKAYHMLINIYTLTKQPKKGIKACTELLKDDPRNATLIAKRGSFYADLNAYKQAFKDYNIAIKLSPKSSTFLSKRADILLKAKKYDEAIQEFKKILADVPNDGDAHLGLGMAYLKQKSPKNALIHLKKAEEQHNAKASELLNTYFGKPITTYKASINKKLEEKFAANKQQHQSSPFLAPLLGKIHTLQVVYTYEALKNELALLPDQLQETVWASLMQSVFVITEDAIYFDEGGPSPLYVGFYSIELETPDAILLNFTPSEGGQSFKVRLFNQEGTLGVTFPLNTKDVSSRYFNAVATLEEEDLERFKTKIQAAASCLPSSLQTFAEAV